MAEWDSRLRRAREQVERRKQAETKRSDLARRREEAVRREEELRCLRRQEQADVDRLEGRSLAALFYSLAGRMDEKLDKERTEARAAAVRHDAAVRNLAELDDEIQALEAELDGLRNCREEYAQAYAGKAEEIRRRDPVRGPELMELEERLAVLSAEERELREALEAGEQALGAAEAAASELSGAADWGVWDLLGGGLLTDLAKHEHLDAAQAQVEHLQVLLSRFQTELADVTVEAEFRVQIDGFLQFADFFFDGLFADWAAMDHISRSQEQIQGTIAQICGLLARLREKEREAGAERAALEARRDALVLAPEAGL